MSTIHELSAVAKDAFVVLSGAVEIKYADGDTWKAEGEESEHPLVHRLRAASIASLTQEPPDVGGMDDDELEKLLKAERKASDNMRQFLIALDDTLTEAGKPDDVRGQEVLTWLKGRLSAGTGS